MLRPCPLLLSRQGSQQLMQGMVEPLTLAVMLGVVWCGPRLLDAVNCAEFLDEFGLKTSALV